MNNLFYLLAFAVCLTNYGLRSNAEAAFSSDLDISLASVHHEDKRVARQSGPPPPEDDEVSSSSPSITSEEDFSRQTREAKGVGGSMPTRKG